jgi:hypothetical protein
MPVYEAGDYVKVEFSDERGSGGEWTRVKVEDCDEESRLVFGRLDSVPVLHAETLKLGQELAVNFDNIRDHMKCRRHSPEDRDGRLSG